MASGTPSAVRVWNAADGAPLRTIDAGASVTCLSVSADSALVAVGGDDKQIRLFALADGAAKGTMSGHEQTVRSVHFSADGQKLVSGAADGTVRV